MSLLMFTITAITIDLRTKFSAQSKLQDAADAAVLTAALAKQNAFANTTALNKAARKALSSTSLDGTQYECAPVKQLDTSVSIKCSGKVKRFIPAPGSAKWMAYDVYSEASFGLGPKLEFTLVYDISDSMLVGGKLKALEKALKELFWAGVFTDTHYDTVFSLVPFANSVAFAPEFARWLDPVDGLSVSPTFNRCFMPGAAGASIPFTGGSEFIAAPETKSTKGRTYCPVRGLEAKFFMTDRHEAQSRISNITTSNGTGSSEALIWGYRTLQPRYKGMFSRNKDYPRSFDDSHKKILVFLTDGKPQNKAWTKPAGGKRIDPEKSERLFREACQYVKSQNDNIDVYMIGFGDFKRKGKSLGPLLSDCIKNDGRMILADNHTLKDELLSIVASVHNVALVH